MQRIDKTGEETGRGGHNSGGRRDGELHSPQPVRFAHQIQEQK
jgi:hypothetical protein